MPPKYNFCSNPAKAHRLPIKNEKINNPVGTEKESIDRTEK